MGFWRDLLSRQQPIAFFEPRVTYLGAEDIEAMVLADQSPSQLWATQPHLRTVISFLARNIAQLGVHSFVREGSDRKRERDSVFARTMLRPNPDQTAYDLIFALVGDIALYDRAYWLVMRDADAASGYVFRRLPPSWVSVIPRDVFGAKAYRVITAQGKSAEVPADQILAFNGYHPTNPRKGSPTVESLKATLSEQIEASKYRAQTWKRGGRVSSVIERPAEAPEWSPEAMKQFREDWYAKYTGDGSLAGGTPILEDGMKLNRIDFTAQEQQFAEIAKLSFTTVAAAYHVNPTMVGVLDNANYSNVREFRRMLYGDTLGPTIAMLEDRINTFLLPMLGMDNAQHFTEFNIAEKLQGSFEEQAAVMSTMVGAPVMTRDEGRAKFNLSAMGGEAAELVTPLNVLVGGQASPRDSGTQNRREPKALPAVKQPTNNQRIKIEQVLHSFFSRQGKVILSRIGSDQDWWDHERWDRELSEDLLKVTHTISSVLGKAQAERLGYEDGYDPDRTVEFLKTVSARYAGNINKTTYASLDEQVHMAEPDPDHVFEVAKDARAAGAAVGIGTFVAGFAAVEAAKQIGQSEHLEPVKTWITGPRARPEHAAMSGETVYASQPFSNGANWPCDSGNPDDAGCNCSVDVSLEQR